MRAFQRALGSSRDDGRCVLCYFNSQMVLEGGRGGKILILDPLLVLFTEMDRVPAVDCYLFFTPHCTSTPIFIYV